MNQKPTLLIVGSGNVAWHLCKAFQLSNFTIRGVSSRNLFDLTEFKERYSVEVFDLNSIPETDIVILAVSDDSIHNVSKLFKNSTSTILHTSGTFGINELDSEIRNKGVIYPYQTFTKGCPVEYADIPTFTEADSSQAKNHIEYLASSFGSKYSIDSNSKKSLHLAGVIANNFINKLIQESIEVLEQKNIPTEVIWPLIEETIKKAKVVGPKNAQTGPAYRKDQKTLNEHIEHLKNNPEMQIVYSKLSKLIQQ